MRLTLGRVTFAACCLLATGLTITFMFLTEKPIVSQFFSGLSDFTLTLLHYLLVGAIMFGAAAFTLGCIFAYAKLRSKLAFHEIRPDKNGYKVQAVVDRNGQLHRLDWDLEQLYGLAGLMKAIPGGTHVYNGATEIEEADEVLQIAGPNIPQIRLSEAIRKLARNALQVYWGKKEDGADCILDLKESTHTQKSGQTGLGKSYLTQTELYCLHTMNDPDIINFAYIDIEGETTEPYWFAPHTWQYPTAPKETQRGIASDLDDVLPLFKAINHELAIRDRNKKENFPYLLVVIEEAEELIDALGELDKKDRDTIMRLWKRVARRGRKRRILLDINVQNTYTDPVMRSAQRQFQLKITAAQVPTTARSGGFQDWELLKRLYDAKKKGLFVVSHESGEYMIYAPFIDVTVPDYVEADAEPEEDYWKSDPDGNEDEIDDFPVIEQQSNSRYLTRQILQMNGSQKRNTTTLTNPRLERLPKYPEPTSPASGQTSETSEAKYEFSESERKTVVNLYKEHGTIEKVLELFGRGARWHNSASRILKEAGLL